MLELLLLMFERIAIIVMVAFLMTRMKYFRTVIERRNVTNFHLIVVMLMFGLFGIIGTYTGLAINVETLQASSWSSVIGENEAIANSRVIGVVIGGLIGGWKVGLGAGLIAGIHRFTLGGFTAFACGFSTIVAGLIAGLLHHWLHKRKAITARDALVIGMVAEALQMGTILLVAKPFEDAFVLVNVIGAPMIIANGIGSALFILIIKSVFREEEKVGALQAQKSLFLAKITTAHLRNGLNEKSAQNTCEILKNEVASSAVAITNTTHILSYVGLGSDHHHKNDEIKTEAVRHVLKTGRLLVASRNAMRCNRDDCPLHMAVIAPLKNKQDTIGTLIFYFKTEVEVKQVTIELIKGLSSILSQQLEIANAEKYYQLAKDAEIKALQAQVSPHFLFNSLNTIVSMIRTEPTNARKLLVSFSRYFRRNLEGVNDELTSLEREIERVSLYLELEKARFNDKLQVNYDVDETLLSIQIPPMTIQPLVENIMKHGLRNMKVNSKISIEIKKVEHGAYISVSDNGIGIETKRLQVIGHKPLDSQSGTGIGLYNVNRRLLMLFGVHSELKVESKQGQGTTVSFLLPTNVKEVEENVSNY